MKYSLALASLLVVLPLALEVSAIPATKDLPKLKATKVAKGGKNVAAAKKGNQLADATKDGVAAAAASSAAASSGQDLQSSLTLDPNQVMDGLFQNGQAQPEAGQVASETSKNNFINFCAQFPDLPLTNGQQILTGSCNPVPMGQIIAKSQMPSAKITDPANLSNVASNTTFTFKINTANMETGNFVNAQLNFMGAPQQLNKAGLLVAHSHITVNKVKNFQDTDPVDPTKFNFFKGLNAAAVNNVLTADVDGGLPDGTYRACTLNTGANHGPALVAVAQHASLDDCTYFTVGQGGLDENKDILSKLGAGGAAKNTAAATGGSKKPAPAKGKGKAPAKAPAKKPAAKKPAAKPAPKPAAKKPAAKPAAKGGKKNRSLH